MFTDVVFSGVFATQTSRAAKKVLPRNFQWQSLWPRDVNRFSHSWQSDRNQSFSQAQLTHHRSVGFSPPALSNSSECLCPTRQTTSQHHINQLFFASTARRSGLFKRFRLAASQSHAKSAATGLIAAHHLQGISAASPDSLRCAATTTYIASLTTIRTKSDLPLRRECDLHSAAAKRG